MNQKIIKCVPIIQAYFEDKPVDKAWLFGSCSRGEETIESDIDILVEYTPGKIVSLLTICKYRVDLSQLLNRQADIVERQSLMDFAKANVEHEKILIYERKNKG